MNYSMNLKFKATFFVLIFFGGILLFPPIFAEATTPFGGKIIQVKYCNCSNNWLIRYRKTSGFMPDSLSFRLGVSTLYPYDQIYLTGMEILGITISPDLCVRGHHCHNVTPTSLIKMVGTSGPGHLAGSGSSAFSGSSSTGSVNNNISGSGYGGTDNNSQLNTTANEANNRQQLGQNGINVTSSGGCQDCSNRTCTCVGGMTQPAMTDAENLKQQCPSCQVDVTGSTEYGHHDGCGGNCFDLQRGSGSGYENLDSEIESYDRVPNGSAAGYNCSDSSPCYRQGDTIYYQENNAHWHVQTNYFQTGRPTVA